LANSIVFQNSAEQLKASVFGFDGTNYKALKVNSSGELIVGVGTVNLIETINTLSSITNGTIKVSSLTNGTVKASISSITNGTVNVTSLTNGTIKLASSSATLKVNLVDRAFTSTTQTISVAAASSTFTNLIDISKYQDTTWYLRNTTASSTVSVRLAVTPSTNLTSYPLALIQETATLRNSTRVMTNSYYLKYATMEISNVSGTAQNIVVVFNGRY